jgi:hypothetical protein
MSVMDRTDRMMLMVAWTALGVLLLESVVPLFVGWVNPFLDQRGLPRVCVPVSEVVLFIVCLWYLQVTLCRIVLGIGAGLLLFFSALASFLVITQLHVAVVKFGNFMLLAALMESLYCFGFFSLLWVSFRPPVKRQMLPGNLSLRHARV